MTPNRLEECLATIRWTPGVLSRAMKLPDSLAQSWLSGDQAIPTRVASWLEALSFTHESADLLMPVLGTGARMAPSSFVTREEHVPTYSYHLLRRLNEGPVALASLFGTEDEAAVFFLVSRNLAERDGSLLAISNAGRKVGEIASRTAAMSSAI